MAGSILKMKHRRADAQGAVSRLTALERLEWISDPARFAALAPHWDALAEAQATPFTSHAWLAAWWDAFATEGDELSVGVLWRGDELAAGLPLMRRGGALHALANWHTPVFGAVAAEPAAKRALAAGIVASRARLVVPALEEGGATLGALTGAARDARVKHILEPAEESPIVDLEGDWDSYRRETKSRWGAPLERWRRKMGRDHRLEARIVETPADLDHELERGLAVEASGWKGRAGTAITSSPSTERFYRRIAAESAARGTLRLSWLALDGEMAAFDLSLLHAGRLWLLKTGYDERFRKLGPGLVLRMWVIERCYELGLDAHELLGGTSDWKLKFATSSRRHVALRTYPIGPAYAFRRYGRPVLKLAYQRLRRTG
jgi:CelD/BcsL family acetyltransferase involved in cellulose biosynthesis